MEFCEGGTWQGLKTGSDAPTRRSKTFCDMCIRLDTVPQRDGGRQTDRLTELVNQRRAVSTLTRDKNGRSNSISSFCRRAMFTFRESLRTSPTNDLHDDNDAGSDGCRI